MIDYFPIKNDRNFVMQSNPTIHHKESFFYCWNFCSKSSLHLQNHFSWMPIWIKKKVKWVLNLLKLLSAYEYLAVFLYFLFFEANVCSNACVVTHYQYFMKDTLFWFRGFLLFTNTGLNTTPSLKIQFILLYSTAAILTVIIFKLNKFICTL